MSSRPPERQFMKFVIPSMLAMLLNGFYTMVDGFFIGQVVGDAGLAGIGLAWPITAVLMALGVGIGTGGAVLVSTSRGEQDEAKANRAQASTFFLLLLCSILTTLALVLSYPALLRWLGAAGDVYQAAEEYIVIIAWGGSMQIIASGLTPLIRNNHRTVQAMLIMCSGLITNIILDAWFLMGLQMGLGGAALATIIAQAVTAVLCILSLITEKAHRFRLTESPLSPALIRRILQVGLSPFGLSLMPSLISLFTNWQCLAYGGDNAVAAYCVVNYLVFALMLLLQGVGDGLQPLVSFCVGAGLDSSRRILQRKGVLLVLGMSCAFVLVSFPLCPVLPVMFGTSADTGTIIARSLPILCASFPMMGMVKLFTSYFYASGHTAESSVLVYADPILLTPIALWVLPLWFDLDGVWLSLPAAQTGLALILAGMLLYNRFSSRRISAK